MKYQSKMRSVLTGLAMAMTMTVATASAQTSTDAQPPSTSLSQPTPADACSGKPGMQSGRHMSGHGKHASHRMSGHGQGGMPGVGHFPANLVEQLALTDKQKVAWMDAQTAASAMKASGKQIREAQRASMGKSTAQDSFDPRAMIEQQNKMHASMQANREAVQKKWLFFWDSLSKDQQAKVAEFMKQNMAEKGNRTMGPRAG